MPTVLADPAGRPFVAVLDVSGWQMSYAGNGRLNPGARSPDLHKAVALGVAGVIARVGNGSTLDQSFARYAQAAASAALPLGAYYYAQPRRLAAEAAAELVIDWLDRTEHLAGHGELPVMLDLEEYHGDPLTRDELGDWTARWLRRVEQLDGRRPLLYAGHAFANPGTITGTFAAWDTIQPRYAKPGAPPADPADWPDWIRWDREPTYTPTLGAWSGYQFTASGDWPAYGGPPDSSAAGVDLNIVHLAAWQRWTGNPEWSAPMSALHLATPSRRIVDTRTDRAFGRQPVAYDSTFKVPIPDDLGAVPSAAVITVTVTAPTAAGHIVLWADELVDPPTSSLNFAAGQTVANTTLAAVAVDEAGDRIVRGMIRGPAGRNTAHIIVDLIGVIA